MRKKEKGASEEGGRGGCGGMEKGKARKKGVGREGRKGLMKGKGGRRKRG